MYKIAFFGSDLFSLASFKEVLKLRHARPDLVQSLSLVTRQLKYSGRGMKNIVKPQIVEFAESQEIDWHQVETPAQFDLLKEISNLAVAVSYGRLIPASYLNLLQYGGLNVHPSLLPQYRGSSPLQWAIMDQQSASGVSVQTLHPTKFDHGEILWQSEEVPLDKRETYTSLTEKLGLIGAQGLVRVLETSDLSNPSSSSHPSNNHIKPSLAPIISKSLHKISFSEPFSVIDARGRALGKLYFEQHIEQKQPKRGKPKGHPILRVNLSQFDQIESVENDTSELGSIVPGRSPDGKPLLCLRLKDGYIGAAEVTVQGFKAETAEDYFAQKDKRKMRGTVL